jgi:hypothetical protein
VPDSPTFVRTNDPVADGRFAVAATPAAGLVHAAGRAGEHEFLAGDRVDGGAHAYSVALSPLAATVYPLV